MGELIDDIGCSDLTVHKVFRVGVPFQELIRAIDEEGPDLMVMGQKRAPRHNRRSFWVECRKGISSLSDTSTQCAVGKPIK